MIRMRSSTPFLPPEECTRVEESVLGLERYWIRRHEELPSFTLGAACYLDVVRHGTPSYYRLAVRGNRRAG